MRPGAGADRVGFGARVNVPAATNSTILFRLAAAKPRGFINRHETRPIGRERFFASLQYDQTGVDRGRLMYEAFYKLSEKPFSILPDPDLIYWGRTHRMAFSMLEFGVMNNAQFTVITGDVGSGKTTLVRHLLRRLDPRKTNVGLISNTPQERDELLQWIMVSLNLPFEGTTCRYC